MSTPRDPSSSRMMMPSSSRGACRLGATLWVAVVVVLAVVLAVVLVVLERESVRKRVRRTSCLRPVVFEDVFVARGILARCTGEVLDVQKYWPRPPGNTKVWVRDQM